MLSLVLRAVAGAFLFLVVACRLLLVRDTGNDGANSSRGANDRLGGNGDDDADEDDSGDEGDDGALSSVDATDDCGEYGDEYESSSSGDVGGVRVSLASVASACVWSTATRTGSSFGSSFTTTGSKGLRSDDEKVRLGMVDNRDDQSPADESKEYSRESV